ncbi:MAG TPA: hypothetical protein VLN90_00420 [Thioalkalivibrio sp.]|nr:hypothetical protein [Thioalkalivibrio sp.]
MFGLFQKQTVIDDESRQWIHDVYAWALRNFGSDVFHEQTILVTPSAEHFPGRADSLHAMAQLIFEQVKQHAGLAHWPARLVPPEAFDPDHPQRLELSGAIRGVQGVKAETVDPAHCLVVSYMPNRVSDPEALIATYAHTLAGFMASLARDEPPGGQENWPHATEVLAVFMGFGLMMSNTAYATPKTGCASCRLPGADRESHLSQYDLTYALALFCALKGIGRGEVLSHLKAPLRGYFKRALNEVRSNAPQLVRLRAMDTPLATHVVSSQA